MAIMTSMTTIHIFSSSIKLNTGPKILKKDTTWPKYQLHSMSSQFSSIFLWVTMVRPIALSMTSWPRPSLSTSEYSRLLILHTVQLSLMVRKTLNEHSSGIGIEFNRYVYHQKSHRGYTNTNENYCVDEECQGYQRTSNREIYTRRLDMMLRCWKSHW